jgi:hypothetical protein
VLNGKLVKAAALLARKSCALALTPAQTDALPPAFAPVNPQFDEKENEHL